MLDGRLYTGRSGNAGAVGSMPVPTPDGRSRQLIEVASLVCLERSVVARGLSAQRLWDAPGDWSLPHDVIAEWIEVAAHGLAHAIVACASIVDIEAALIDGWMPAAVRDALAERVREEVAEINLTGIEPPRVATGTVGPDARALGAASLPLSESFLVDPIAIMKPQ